MPSYLLDTNILLAAVNNAAPQHPLVVNVISSLSRRGEPLFITPQVLREFWAVATRPLTANGFGWTPSFVSLEINRLISQFLLLQDNSDVFDHWLRLVTSYRVSGKPVHDARLVAVMQAHGVSHILTFNIKDQRTLYGYYYPRSSARCIISKWLPRPDFN